MKNPVTARDVLDAFTYSFSPIAETIRVRGVSVVIWQDQFAENPYERGEGMAPALWLHPDGHHGDLHEYGGQDLEAFFGHVPLAWVSRHWRAIAKALDLTETVFDAECREDARDWGASLPCVRREKFADYLAEKRATTWGAGRDYLETLAALYRLAKIPADTFQRNGYSQGDSAYGLIVHIPAWCELVGAGGDIAADMKGDADTYGAWCWGDVYGFTVPDGEEPSCGGFYGFDVEYMAECIAGEVNAVLTDRATIEAAQLAAARLDLAPQWCDA